MLLHIWKHFRVVDAQLMYTTPWPVLSMMPPTSPGLMLQSASTEAAQLTPRVSVVMLLMLPMMVTMVLLLLLLLLLPLVLSGPFVAVR